MCVYEMKINVSVNIIFMSDVQFTGPSTQWSVNLPLILLLNVTRTKKSWRSVLEVPRTNPQEKHTLLTWFVSSLQVLLMSKSFPVQ